MRNVHHLAFSTLLLYASGARAERSGCQCSGEIIPNTTSIKWDRIAGGDKSRDDFGGSHCSSTLYGVPFCIVGSRGTRTDAFESCSIDGNLDYDGDRHYYSYEPCATAPLPQCRKAPSYTASDFSSGRVTNADGVCQCDAADLVKNTYQDIWDRVKWQQCAEPDKTHADRCSSLSVLSSSGQGGSTATGGASARVESCPGWSSSTHKDACFLRNRGSAQSCAEYCGQIGIAEGTPDAKLWTCAFAGDTMDEFKCALEVKGKDMDALEEEYCQYSSFNLCGCVPPNECSCSNGNAAVGPDCLVHLAEQCVDCVDGYALDEETLVCALVTTTLTRTTNTKTTTTGTTRTTRTTSTSTSSTSTITTTTATATTTTATTAATGTSTATSKLIDEATLTDAQRLKGGVDVDGGSISTTAPPSSNSKDISGSSVAGIVVGLCVLVAVVGVGIVLRNHLEKPAPRKSADSRGGSFDVHSVMFGGVAGEEGGQSTSTSPRKAGSSYSLNNPRKIQVRSSVFEVNQTSCA